MIYNNLQILEKYWFSQLANSKIIGIIKCKDMITKEIKIYIGLALGNDEIRDIKFILDYGSKIDKEVFKILLNKD